MLRYGFYISYKYILRYLFKYNYCLFLNTIGSYRPWSTRTYNRGQTNWKTAIAIDTILNQKQMNSRGTNDKVHVVWVAPNFRSYGCGFECLLCNFLRGVLAV
jgi:hypothetical protein